MPVAALMVVEVLALVVDMVAHKITEAGAIADMMAVLDKAEMLMI